MQGALTSDQVDWPRTKYQITIYVKTHTHTKRLKTETITQKVSSLGSQRNGCPDNFAAILILWGWLSRAEPHESQSKPGTKMVVFPEPCRGLRRRNSAAISGKGIVPYLQSPGFDSCEVLPLRDIFGASTFEQVAHIGAGIREGGGGGLGGIPLAPFPVSNWLPLYPCWLVLLKSWPNPSLCSTWSPKKTRRAAIWDQTRDL